MFDKNEPSAVANQSLIRDDTTSEVYQWTFLPRNSPAGQGKADPKTRAAALPGWTDGESPVRYSESYRRAVLGNFDFRANLFELLGDRVGLVLRHVLFDRLRRFVDERLGFF